MNISIVKREVLLAATVMQAIAHIVAGFLTSRFLVVAVAVGIIHSGLEVRLVSENIRMRTTKNTIPAMMKTRIIIMDMTMIWRT